MNIPTCAVSTLAAAGWSVLWDGGLTVGIFLLVALLIVGVFRQRGDIKLSPQREAAIAMGHTDRVTIFEKPMLRPILWLMLSISHRLAVPGVKDRLRRRLVAAGSPNYYTAEEYLAKSLFTGIMLAAVLVFLNFLLYGNFSFLAIALGLVFGTGLDMYQLHEKASRRIRAIWKSVPYALDLISLAMGAGATFTEAVTAIVRDKVQRTPLDEEDPFNMELRAMLAEMDLGTTRRQALLNLADRVPLDSLRSIVASVVQAEELGTSLGEVLHNQATLLRQQRTVRAENAAAVAGVRILIPCLLLVIAVILAIFGPLIVQYLRKGLI